MGQEISSPVSIEAKDFSGSCCNSCSGVGGRKRGREYTFCHCGGSSCDIRVCVSFLWTAWQGGLGKAGGLDELGNIAMVVMGRLVIWHRRVTWEVVAWF